MPDIYEYSSRAIVAANIKMFMREKGVTASDVCKALNIPNATFSDWINAKTYPRISKLEKLADYFGVRKADLVDLSTERNDPILRLLKTETEESAQKSARESDAIYDALNCEGQKEFCRYGRYLTTQEEFKALDTEPQVEYIRHYLTSAAAGYAAPVEGEDYEMVVRGADVPAKADFCIDISGDSMEPYIKDGQTVYVQRGADLKEFEVGIFFVDGDVFCKQWCPGYDGSLYLLSANPKRQDANIIVSRDAGRNCVCFGKVLLNKKLPRPMYL